MEYRDYYKILGVPRAASQAEIKKAFRKLAREHHPDVKPGDRSAERRFKDVNEAHTVLSDPDKRKRYDALGSNWEAFSRSPGGRPGADPFGQGGPFAGFGGNVRYEFRTSGDAGDLGGFSDFFRMVFGAAAGNPGGGQARQGASRSRSSSAGSGPLGLDEMLSQMGIESDDVVGARRRATAGASPPAVEASAELSLEEAFSGTSRIVEVEGKRLEVTIPPGVDSGSRIRLTGRGGGGRDLLVVCQVRSHPVFERRGADLEREVTVSLRQVILGAEVTVETLTGRVLLTIPAGTQPGRTFRLTGQGMPRYRGTGRGDLYARVKVVLPGRLSAPAAEAARRFLDLAEKDAA